MFIVCFCTDRTIQLCKISDSVIMAHLCLNYIFGKQFSGTLINQLMKRIINLYSWNFFIFFRVMNQSFIQNRHFVKQLTVRIFKNSINHAHLKTFSDKPLLCRTSAVNTCHIGPGLWNNL